MFARVSELAVLALARHTWADVHGQNEVLAPPTRDDRTSSHCSLYHRRTIAGGFPELLVAFLAAHGAGATGGAGWG